MSEHDLINRMHEINLLYQMIDESLMYSKEPQDVMDEVSRLNKKIGAITAEFV